MHAWFNNSSEILVKHCNWLLVILFVHVEARDGWYCFFEEQYGIRNNTSVSLNTLYIVHFLKTWVSYDLHLYPHCASSESYLLKEQMK